MASRLFIHNIHRDVIDAELHECFSQVGTVLNCYIATDHDTYESRGFGFVTMSTVEEAQAAIDAFSEVKWRGRRMGVRFALPKQ